MRTLFASAMIAALLPLGASAQSFRADNFLDVVPLSGTTFEVIEANGEGPRGIWCAAADYASKRLQSRRFHHGRQQPAARTLPVIFAHDLAGRCRPAGQSCDPVLPD